jgi:hypothetical protein
MSDMAIYHQLRGSSRRMKLNETLLADQSFDRIANTESLLELAHQLRILCYPSLRLLMTHFVKSQLNDFVTCPYCSAKLFWFPAIDEGLVARQNCPRMPTQDSNH